MRGRKMTKSDYPEELDTPAVLVDLTILKKNIAAMAAFAQKHGLDLRPHVKSHKTKEIAELQLAAGATGLTVAKLDEAEAMVAAGFRDILVAYELIGEVKLRRLLDLTRRARLSVLIDSEVGARQLSAAAASQGLEIPCLIEIDSGLGRTGVRPGQPAVELARAMKSLPGLKLRGLLTHAGHAYGAKNQAELNRIAQAEAEAVLQTARLLAKEGWSDLALSVGSTPTVRISGTFPGITEIRPGNYVFNDATQIALGVAREEECALTVLTTVISRPAPDRAVVDAGAKTLALDRGAHGTALLNGYGMVKNHPEYIIERLSEEHGILALPPNSRLQVGDRLEVIPNHACPVVNLTDYLYIVEQGKVTGEWRVLARGGVR